MAYSVIPKGFANQEIARYTIVAIRHKVAGCKIADAIINSIVDCVVDYLVLISFFGRLKQDFASPSTKSKFIIFLSCSRVGLCVSMEYIKIQNFRICIFHKLSKLSLIYLSKMQARNSESTASAIIDLLVTNSHQKIVSNSHIKNGFSAYTNNINHKITDNLVNHSQKPLPSEMTSMTSDRNPISTPIDNFILKSIKVLKKQKKKEILSLNKTQQKRFSRINSKLLYTKGDETCISEGQNLRNKMKKLAIDKNMLKLTPYYSQYQTINEDFQQQLIQNQLRKKKISSKNKPEDNFSDEIQTGKQKILKNKTEGKNFSPNSIYIETKNLASLSKPFPIALNFSMSQQKCGQRRESRTLKIDKKRSLFFRANNIKQQIKDSKKQKQCVDKDAFNNNDSRQTTSIPFFKPEIGISFSQSPHCSHINKRHNHKNKTNSSFVKFFSAEKYPNKLKKDLANQQQEEISQTKSFSSQKIKISHSQNNGKYKKRIQSAHIDGKRNRIINRKSSGSFTEINEKLMAQLIL